VIRSFLFVPGDSQRKLEKSTSAGADALIVDLEDAVAAEARPAARALTRDFVASQSDVWIRINPVGSDDAAADLEAVMPAAPAGIVLPKPRSADDVKTLSAMIGEAEAKLGLEEGATKILPLVTETPQSLFALGDYAGCSDRLAAMSWGAEDLSAAVGATRSRDENGDFLAPYQFARSLCLFAAAAAEVPAIDTVFTDFRNAEGLAQYATEARRDGFSGMLAIHPAQVETINAAFQPTAEEIDRARRIVALFDANPGAGTIGMDGQMIDRPHLVQAKRILGLA
jgi:citrate lyase subunit beta/citryl-CoA lyase